MDDRRMLELAARITGYLSGGGLTPQLHRDVEELKRRVAALEAQAEGRSLCS